MATEPGYHGGNLLVSALAERGVRHVFSVSGGPLNPIYVATLESSVRLIHTRHEAAAGFMADATARLTGVPGVCAVTLGPGTTNVATAVLTARMAGVPMLVIGGQAPVRTFDRGAGMSFDALPMMSTLTKWSARVLTTNRIPEYVDKAWRQMLSGRPGPVFLEIPSDVLGGPAEPVALDRRPSRPVRGPGIDPAAAEQLCEAVAAARRPLVLAGDDVHWSSSGDLLRRVIDEYHLPFALLRLARGCVDERHPLCGGVGYVGANRSLRAILGEADLLLLLGHDFEFDLDFGDFVRRELRVVQVHPEASLLDRNVAADLSIQSTAEAALRALLPRTSRTSVDEAWADGVGAAWRGEREQLSLEGAGGEPLHPVRLVQLVAEAAPKDSVFVTSHGNVDFWADAWLQPAGPRRYLRAGQSGSLGAEVPYGVAARLAAKDAPVIIFVGDGGFGFHGMELETAARYQLPVVVVVADDSSWGAIALPQRRAYGVEVEMGLPRREWSQLARALGCHGEAPQNEAEVGPAIQRSLESGRPAVVHVAIRSVESPYMRYLSGG